MHPIPPTAPQQVRLLAHLRLVDSVTPLEAWKELGIYRLSAVVYELREAGYDIDTAFVSVTNQFGEPCRIARYTLNEKGVGR